MKNILYKESIVHIKHAFRMMKNTFLALFIFAGTAYATNSYSQNMKVTVVSNSISAEKVISEIESQTDYLFVYDVNNVNLKKKVKVNAHNKPVAEVLDQIFTGTNIAYAMEGKNIMLMKKKEEVVTPQQVDNMVTGIVKDSKGESIIGANIKIKDQTSGTITDFDGRFTLEVSENSILQVSYIGYITQEIKVGTQKNLTITLKEDTETLDEVVVVGYGSQRKINLTGSVASVSNKELQNRPITAVSTAIQGLMPGVTITSSDGQPGADGASIRVRGQGTLNNADPYILVDGVEEGSINQIDANDIESISVLKDAAAAAIYGSKASNGVILITTKRGSEGKPVVSYNASVGFQSPTAKVERMDSWEAADFYNRALENSGKATRFEQEDIELFKNGTDPYGHPNTDWYDLAYNSGFIHKHNISVSGGTKTVRYMNSIGFLGQDGVLRNSGRKQFNVRSNVDIKVSDRLNMRSNLSYINNYYWEPNNSRYGDGPRQVINLVNTFAPWIPYKNEDGSYGGNGDGNPIAWLDMNERCLHKGQKFTGIMATDYKLIDGLVLTAQGSYTMNLSDYKAFMKDIQLNEDVYQGANELTETMSVSNRMAFDGLLNYNKIFGKHHVKGLAGYRVEKYNYKTLTGNRTGFPTNEQTDLGAGQDDSQTNDGYSRELALMSYFARINYDYMGKFLLEVNFRADASSRFNKDNRWGYFPGISAGWRISEENFMKRTKGWLQSLKLRVSWGQLGNQEAIDDYYPALSTYSIGKNFVFDGVVHTGICQVGYKQADITWETTTTTGIGIDMSFLDHFNVSLDYYYRKTTDMLMDVQVPATFGFGAYMANIGSMENEGVELSTSWQQKFGNWTLGATGNFAYNRNEILSLGEVTEMINDYYINRVGSPYNSYYTYVVDGIFRSDEEAAAYQEQYGNPFNSDFKAGDLKFKDVNGDGALTSDDKDLIGTNQPKFTYGLSFNAAWKNIDLSIMGQGVTGTRRYFTQEVVGDFKGDASHPSTAWRDAWSKDNPNGSFPRPTEGTASHNHQSTRSSFWCFDTDYFRIKNLQIGYTFPKSWLTRIGVDRARLYYSGENLFTFDNLPVDIDPESGNGSVRTFPNLKTHSIGINLTF